MIKNTQKKKKKNKKKNKNRISTPLHLVYPFYDEYSLSYRYGKKYFLRPDYPKPAL